MKDIQKNTGIKVCLFGASLETGNLGVSALTESAIKVILTRWPDAEISLIGLDSVGGECRIKLSGREVCIKKMPIRFCKNIFLPNHFCVLFLYGFLTRIFRWQWLHKALADRNPYFKALTEAELAADITGGDSFSDIYGMRRFILGFLHKWLVGVFQKKLILFPQTYGPFNRYVTKILARRILNYTTVIYSRDQSGISYVKKLLNTENTDGKIRFLYDLGFVLDSRRPESRNINSLEQIKAKNRALIGLNVSGLLSHGGYSGDNRFNLMVDYPALIKSVIELFMGYGDTAVLLVPHVFTLQQPDMESDAAACGEVFEQTAKKYKDRIFLVHNYCNQNEIKYIIGLCSFFIGSRMHACIAALSQGIPAVGLAYSKKFAGVFESVGVGELVVDMRQHTQEEILTAIRTAFEKQKVIRDRLRSIIPDVQAEILSIFKDFQ